MKDLIFELQIYMREKNPQINDIDTIVEENFPKLKKDTPTVIIEAYKATNRQDQKRKPPQHITIKILSVQNKEVY